MSITKNLIKAETLSLDAKGYRSGNNFLVDAVGGSAESRLYNAMTTSGIPQYGEPHPTIPDIVVIKVQAKPEGGGKQIRVSVIYGIPEDAVDSSGEGSPGVASLSTNLSAETVWRDINGNLLKAQYQGLVGFIFQTQTRYMQADVERPQVQVSLSRSENELPKAAMTKYLGTVNAVNWSGFPPKTWLCSSITSRDNKGKFETEYQFTYRVGGWRAEVVVGITNDEADTHPIDADSGNGFAAYDVYHSTDFNELGLSF